MQPSLNPSMFISSDVTPARCPALGCYEEVRLGVGASEGQVKQRLPHFTCFDLGRLPDTLVN